MVPILYLLCFTIAYFGPNSALIGNVGSSKWQYQAVEDFGYSFSLVFIFCLVDVCSAIIGAILLWCFCGIKLHRAYVEIQNEFGIAFSFILGTNLNGVSIQYVYHWIIQLNLLWLLSFFNHKRYPTITFISVFWNNLDIGCYWSDGWFWMVAI